MTPGAETAVVSFVRDGFQQGGVIHLAGTFAEVPADLAAMSPEQQIRTFGDVFFVRGLRADAIPSSVAWTGGGEPPPDDDPVLTAEQAAKILGITPLLVRRLVFAGRLPAVKDRTMYGRKATRILIRQSDLGNLLGDRLKAALQDGRGTSQGESSACCCGRRGPARPRSC